MKQPDLKTFDRRTLKRNIQQGLIQEEDYKKFLKTLPDDKENCEEVPFEDKDQEEKTAESA